jgi:hypothetical protein
MVGGVVWRVEVWRGEVEARLVTSPVRHRLGFLAVAPKGVFSITTYIQ